LLLRNTVVALEIVTVAVVYFAWPLDVSLVPYCLYFSFVGESDHSKTLLFAIDKVTLIDCTVAIVICSLSVLLAIDPHTFIGISIGITHFTFAILEIVFPLALVYISIRVVILAVALFACLHYSFKALSIFEQVCALKQ
jgi:hypothetical protein